MWVNAKVQMALGVLAGLSILAGCFAALYWFLAPERFPVSQVEIRGNLKNTTRAEIEAALPRVEGNFFAADLGEVRARVERLPWVRRVAVRRVWPAGLEVAIEEHVALARWGAGEEMNRLVNVQGEVFAAKSKEVMLAFVAPPGTSAEVARRYRRFAEIVAPLDTKIDRVVLSPRHAWQLRLANGQQLMLGRDIDAAEARLRQFVEIYPRKFDPKRRHEYVDLRYPNGFALRVPEPKSGS
jgi:cell division protein FtsQ